MQQPLLGVVLKLFNINKNIFYNNLLKEIAKKLGSDIPACLYSSALNMKKYRGKKFLNFPINIKKAIIHNNYIILISPNKAISTKIVFNNWRKKASAY